MLIFNICIIIEALTGFFPLGLRSFRQTAGIFFPGCGGKSRQPAVSGAAAAASSGVRT